MIKQLEHADENIDDIVKTCDEVIMECKELDSLCDIITDSLTDNIKTEKTLNEKNKKEKKKWTSKSDKSIYGIVAS